MGKATSRHLPAETRFGVDICVTNRCNLACSYCYVGRIVRGGEVRRLSADQMKRAIDMLTADSGIRARYDAGLNLGFLGGEPLIEFNSIKETIGYVRAKGIASDIILTTNGTLLTADKMDFLAANGVTVYVSIDGDKRANDACRKFIGGGNRSVFDVVMGNLARLAGRDEYTKHIRISQTFTRRTIRSMPGSADFYRRRGFNQIELAIDDNIELDELGGAVLREVLQKTRSRLLKRLKSRPGNRWSGLLDGVYFSHDWFPEVKRGEALYERTVGMMMLFYDGYFYNADLPYPAPEYRIGDLEHGLDLARLDALCSAPEFLNIRRAHPGGAVLLPPLIRYRTGRFNGFSRARLDKLMADTAAVNRIFDEELGQYVKLQMLRRRLLAAPGFGDFMSADRVQL